MEVGKGPNWGCSAKEKKKFFQRLFRYNVSASEGLFIKRKQLLKANYYHQRCGSIYL
jgi:hypothetical protein